VKTIVVNIDHPEVISQRLRFARELARPFNSHIVAVHSIPTVGMSAADLYGGADAIESLRAMYMEDAKRLRASTEHEMDDSSCSWEWKQSEREAGATLIDQSKIADLILVGPTALPDIAGLPPLKVSPAVACHACAPIMVVPVEPPTYKTNTPVVVGCNDSIEAARAIKLTLPLLQAASEVQVVHIPDNAVTQISHSDICAYLLRLGVRAHSHSEAKLGSVADTLQNVAKHCHASLMVCGAYGRSRLAEYIFGGVSSEFLRNPSLPVVMTH
jgi:nucleotide-binding universal stress UspA family protein